MQYSKIFSVVAILVAAAAAAPACAPPATPGAPGAPTIPGVPTIPGHPTTPNHGTDGVPAGHGDDGSATCAKNSQYSYAWCCTDAVCQAFIGGLNVCPSIGGVASIITCCQNNNNNKQEVEQGGNVQGGLVNVGNVAAPISIDALNCIA